MCQNEIYRTGMPLCLWVQFNKHKNTLGGRAEFNSLELKWWKTQLFWEMSLTCCISKEVQFCCLVMWPAVLSLLSPITGFCFCKSIASQELMNPKLFFLCCWMWDHHNKFEDILLPYSTWEEGMCFLMGYMEKMNLWLAVRRFRAEKISLSFVTCK